MISCGLTRLHCICRAMNSVAMDRPCLTYGTRIEPLMDLGSPTDELPLLTRTPVAWAATVLQQPQALLNDHAYLEKKAASNALELLNRWPGLVCPPEWITMLAAIADDEAAHLRAVLRILTRRGGRLERTHRNPYANALRRLVRTGCGNQELLDRLIISALIEVRSCERFDLLARASDNQELSRFYERLGASEFGHYRVFLRLAHLAATNQEVEARWEEMLKAESEIIASQPPGPRMHSGL